MGARDGPGPAWGPTLFDGDEVVPDGAFGGARRHELAHGAWIEHVPGWLHGAAAVFDELVAGVPWRSGRRLMYGRFVDEPRLVATGPGALDRCVIARPAVDAMVELLSARYGRPLTEVGLNYYRDGADSVAWHGDRVLRDRWQAVVATVSVGGHRPFRLRPRAGGPSRELRLGGGDLLVMGGTCQRTWLHGVPKVRSAPPRIAVMFRAPC